jgi:hypothetical protein
MDAKNFSPELDRALAEMWQRPRTLPKEPWAVDIFWQLADAEGQSHHPGADYYPTAMEHDRRRGRYLERNGFPERERDCSKCGRLFVRTRKEGFQNVTRCPDCRSGKKGAPIWGALPKSPRERKARKRRPEQVSAPVEARSDEAALFELLAQLGCRMPEGGAR